MIPSDTTAHFPRICARGLQVAVAVRHTGKLASLVAETGVVAIRTDAADVGSVVRLLRKSWFCTVNAGTTVGVSMAEKASDD